MLTIESEECDFYVVADGEVSVARDGEAVDILGSGETFGEENLFHKETCLVPQQLLALLNGLFFKTFGDNQVFGTVAIAIKALF